MNTYTTTVEKPMLEIFYDSDMESPRNWDNLGYFYTRGRGTAKGFDYSNCGFYIVTDKTQKELGTPKKSFERVIEQELEEYTNWVNGDVYGFTLYDKNGEEIDSCGGFYDLEAIKQNLPKEWENENLETYIKY